MEPRKGHHTPSRGLPHEFTSEIWLEKEPGALKWRDGELQKRQFWRFVQESAGQKKIV